MNRAKSRAIMKAARRIVTAGDVRDQRARQEAAAIAKEARQSTAAELVAARRQYERTVDAYVNFGGSIRRLARARAFRRLYRAAEAYKAARS